MTAESISARRRKPPRPGVDQRDRFDADVLVSGRRTLAMHAAAMNAAVGLEAPRLQKPFKMGELATVLTATLPTRPRP